MHDYSHNYSIPQDTEHEVIAHFSPSEMKEMIELQGGEDFDARTGLPSFKNLYHIMNHESIRPAIHDWARQSHANGGNVEGINAFIRDSGRYGDTKAAVIPRPLAELFDAAIGGPSINPETRKREYFLGGLFNGLKNVFSTIAKPLAGIGSSILRTAAPVLGGLASTGLGALGHAVGAPGLGDAFGSTASDLVNGLVNQGADFVGGLGGSDGSGQQEQPQADPLQAQAEQQEQQASAAPQWRQQIGQMVNQGAQQIPGMVQKYAPQVAQRVGGYAQNLASSMGLPANYAQNVGQMANSGTQQLANMGARYGSNRIGRMANRFAGR